MLTLCLPGIIGIKKNQSRNFERIRNYIYMEMLLLLGGHWVVSSAFQKIALSYEEWIILWAVVTTPT